MGSRTALALVVTVSCVMLGAVSGASAQALPNGYDVPHASFLDSFEFSPGQPSIEISRERYSTLGKCGDNTPVNSYDPVTGALTCGPKTDNSCYLGTITVDVVVQGKHASFTGRTDCALNPKGCLDANNHLTAKGDIAPSGMCSFTGQARTPLINVKSCVDKYKSYRRTAGICLTIPHTTANAKRRYASVRASWEVKFNGESIGSGRADIDTEYQPAVKSRKGHAIYSDTNFDSFYNYCLSDPWPETYSTHGRIYCWSPGRYGHPARWIDTVMEDR